MNQTNCKIGLIRHLTAAIKGMGFTGVQTVHNFSNRKTISDFVTELERQIAG